MTVSSSTNKSGPYTGDGSVTVFARNFLLLDEDHLEVYQTVGGVDTEITSGFTVDGIGTASGNVTFATAPDTGVQITLIRNVPHLQESDYSSQGSVSPEQIEDDFDYFAMQIQDLAEAAARTPLLPVSFSGAQVVMPSPVAGQVLTGNADGTGWDSQLTVAEVSAVLAAIQALPAGVTDLATRIQYLRTWENETAENIIAGANTGQTILWGEDVFKDVADDSSNLDGVIAIGAGIGYNSNGVGGGILIGEAIGSVGDPGAKNDIIGHFAGVHLDKDGSGDGADRNTIMGSLSMHFATTAERNISIGRNSMHGIQAGSENVNVGYAGLMTGDNPVVDGVIIHQGPWHSGDQNVNMGRDGLRYYHGDNSVAVGWGTAIDLKTSSDNAFVGARGLEDVDNDVSFDNFERNTTLIDGDAVQVGSTVTVTLDSAATLTVGKWVAINGDAITRGTTAIWYQVASVVSSTEFTFTNPVAGDVISTPITMNWHETATAVTPSERNTGIGYRFARTFEQGSNNIWIGNSAGNHQGTTYDDKTIIDVGLYGDNGALISGDNQDKRVLVGGYVSLLDGGGYDKKFAVYDSSAGSDTHLFSVTDDGKTLHGTETEVARHTFFGSTNDGVNAAIGIIDDEVTPNRGTIGLAASGNMTIAVETAGAEVVAKDGDGNSTTISPHNFSLIPDGPSEPMAWAYYSERKGSKINADMTRVVRLVEELTGEKLIFTEGGDA